MKKLNFLSNLRGRGRASQSSDVGSRCRVVADLLPSFCRVNMLKLVSVLVLMLTLGVGNAWGGSVTWTQVAWEDITTSDVIIVTVTTSNGTYLLESSHGTSATPKLDNTGTLTNSNANCTFNEIDAVKWKKDASNRLCMATDAGKWLYTAGSNNGMRVGTTTTGNTWSLDGNYIKSNNNRYLSVYGTTDFRSYTSKQSGQVTRFYKASAAPAYTITAQSNNNSYGTVSLTGTTITATPASGYRVSLSTPYEVTSGTATVTQTGNTFSVTPSSNCTVQINFEAKGCTDHAGTNVTSGASISHDYGPFRAYNNYSTHQILYTKTDLDLAAGKKGTIKSIYFEYAGEAAMAARTLKIYMANTALTALSTSNCVPYSSFTEVYSGTFSCGSAGWNEITLTTPFEYNGLGNLVILIDDNTGSYENYKYFKYHTASTTTKAQIYYDNDGTNVNPATTDWSDFDETNNRPNTKFCIQEADMIPSTVTLMDNSATLTEASAGAGVTLPSRDGCSGYTFAGWTKSWVTAQTSWTTTAPTIIPAGSYTPAGDENLYPVYTKTEGGGSPAFSQYQQVALGGTITAGKYLISTGSYTMAGNGKNGVSFSPGTTEQTSYEYTIAIDGDYFTILGPDSKYVGGENSTSLSFAATLTADKQRWKYVSTGIQNKTNDTRHIKAYGTTDFRHYGTSNGELTYLYKRIETDGSTTSYISIPNCCTPLGTINGSVSWSNATTAVVSWDNIDHVSSWTVKYKTGAGAYSTWGGAQSTAAGRRSVTITGLTPCANYDFQIIATPSSGYCDKDQTINDSQTHNWTVTSTGVTNVTPASAFPSTTCTGFSIASMTPAVGYVLPSTITVSGASHTWNSSTGALTISSVTGNVTITITGALASCSDQYTFAYGATPQNDDPYITNPTKECFSQVSTTTEYQITNFTIPNTNTYYWVGYNGYFYNNGLGSNNASSSRNQFKYMPVANLQGSSCGGTGDSYKHAAAGAYGTLRIFSNYSDNNLYVGFVPAGYQMRVGSGESWSNLQLTQVSSSSVWKSDIMTLDAALVAKKYYVNVWTSGSYSSSDVGVAINNWTDGGSAISSMAFKTNSANDAWDTSTGLSAGMRGFFRTWTDNCANNGYAHFVPVHRLVYDANWPVSGEPAATYSSDVSVEESSNITVPVAPSAPTGYHFVEWNTAENGSGTGYDPGDTYTISAGASADVTLYAQWSNTTTITLSKGTAGSANGSAVGTYGSNTVGSFSAVTYSGTSYRLLGYSKSGTPAEIVIDASGNFVANTTYTDASGNWKSTEAAVTLVAQWQAGHTITWMANGTTYETTFVDAGNTLVLPDVDPTSCDDGDTDTYTTFIGWYNTAAGSNSSPTADISSCGTKATTSITPDANQTYYAVWGDGDLVGETTYEITTSLSAGKTYVFGAVKAAASTTLADNTTIGAIAFSTAYGSTSWGQYVNITPSSTGVISSNDVTDACLWTLESITSGLYSFKKSSDYMYLKDGTGANSAGLNSSAQVYMTNETSTCKDAFMLHPGSESTNRLMLNTGTNYGYRVYASGTSPSASMCPYVRFYEQKVVAGATGFISSCCGSAAVVSVTPDDDELELNIDGEATTSVSVSQTGAASGRYYPPTVTPAATGSTDWAGSYKENDYSVNFTATATGTYTIKAPFRESGYSCDKTGSATITVAANPILTPSSDNIAISATCGAASSATDITVNSRYLAGSSITASIVTSTGSGTLKISSDNSSFDTSNKTITGGTSSKATSHIYVRYDAIADEVGSATGTLTLTQGSTTVNIPITVTVTCGCNIRFTSAANLVQVTAANGIWVEADSELELSGSYLKTNADNANVSIRAYTNNAHFQLKTSGTTGEGTAKTSSANALSLATNVSSNTANGWTGALGVVYKPGAHNTTETATLTVEVYRNGGSTVYNSTTYTLYGRSLPENFVIAVTDGSGNWFAVPADMVAPWGGSCSSGLGTYAPYPIEVDNTTTPTAIVGSTPSRAVYTAAARTGNPNTNPQTLSFKAVSLSAGGTNYYLYGSSTAGTSDGSNTNIQNAAFAGSEKQKWFLDLVNWTNKEYHMHIRSDYNENVLAFTTAGGARSIGQYAPNASTTKKAVYILPATSTCANHIAPKTITCASIDATNYTIQFKPDRTKNYEISLDGSSWTDATTNIVNECTDDDHPTLVEAQIPLATYRGQTVYIRVKDVGGCSESTTFKVPNPSLSVNAGTWMTMTGVAGQTFSNSDNSITISDLASCSNTVNVAVSGTNADKITASINSATGVVTIGMTAANAVAGTYTATLTFTADGATTRTQNIQITIQTLATQYFSKDGTYFSGDILCDNSGTLSSSTVYPFVLAGGLYKSDGSNIEMSDFNGTDVSIKDLTTGVTLTGGVTRAFHDATHIKFALNNQYSQLVAGHTYRISWTNTGRVIYSSTGIPYMDCYYDFLFSADCTAPTAKVACPVGVNSFTANWEGTCTDANSSLNVYTKVAGITICDVDFSAGGIPSAVSTGHSSNPTGSNTIYQYGDYTGGAWNASYGYRIAKDSKKVGVYTKPITTAGTYNIEIEVSSAYSATTFAIVTAQNSGAQISSLSSTSVSSGTTFKTITTSVTITAAQLTTYSAGIKIGVIPTVSNTSNTSAYISYFKVAQSSTKSSVAGYPKNVTCSTKEYDVTGLSANTTYYYTLTNNGNESNEMSVTTRASARTPEMGFDPGYAVLQSDGGGAVSEDVTITDGKVGSMAKYFYSICSVSDISYTITGTNAAMFSADWSGVNYYSDLGGYLDGTLVITYNPGGVEGVHTATLTVTENGTTFELPLKGITCPASFSTMATAATSVGNTTATANWSQSTTGNLMLSMDGVLNAEMILNGGLESGDKTGWTDSGVSGVLGGTITSTNATKHSGSYGLYTPVSNNTAMNIGGSNYGAIFASPVTLTPGTYRMTAWVRGASDASTAGYLTASSVAIGLATINESTHSATKQYATGGLGASNNTWQELTADFEVTVAETYYPFVGHGNSKGAMFIDDVSLVRTAADPNAEGYSAYPITSATSLNLTDLQPSTAYSYYIVNANGCESNVIQFQTTGEVGSPELIADDIEISGSAGETVTATTVVEATNVVNDITLSLGGCTSGLTLNTTKLSSTGGVVSVTYAIPNMATPGSSGTCTVSMITTGLTTPVSFDIHWSVASGMSIETPIVEVTDITNESITVESSEADADGAHIIISREMTPEEIAANLNVGDEIFFSKYYEAYSNTKLWAIFNPTDHEISLANTYVWRSSSSGTWLTDKAFSLAGAGAVRAGYIQPNEEIIVYTSDQVGSCEHSKADMSDWYSGKASDQALSYSGDDALLLVRKDVSGTADNPPTSSVDGETTYSWRKYNDGVNDWWMLDLIGARTAANLPTDGACTTWRWTNCKTSTVESGDNRGWVGTDGKYLDNTTYALCSPYVLSTNRCLLLRERSVKCGNNAVATNVGDMYTLGKSGVPTEWNGAHVPLSGEQATVSCNNFTFVGGYDYAGYYNSWVEMEDVEIAEATPNADGSFTFEDLEIPLYYCHPYHIEVTQTVTLNGVEVDNILAYTDYKVPIVVDVDANTTTADFFRTPHEDNPLTASICNECDVVIRDGAKLTHVSGGQAQFRNMTIYPSAKFSNTANQAFELNRLYMQSLNDAVGYAIINNDGSSIVADTIIHTKRINDEYWYSFTLPYNCDVATIRQLNGKVVGKYWDGSSAYVDEDWTIQYYDGAARQAAGTSAAAGQDSEFWKYVPANGTLQAGQAYIVGLFTTEWAGQHKTLYFPPTSFPGYSESGSDAKTTSVSNWATGLSSEKRHHGWNFTGSPYISRFGESTDGQGMNNPTNLILGKLAADGSYESETEVYVSIPDGGNSKTYTQVRAAATTLDPFKGYFVQAIDPTNGEDGTLTLTYAKGNRALEAPARRAVKATKRVVADIKVEGNGKEDIGGIVVDERYTADYEIGGDLTKLLSTDDKPQVYFLDKSSEKMAYIALPDAEADDVPMEIYAPKAGTYTISLNERSSRTSGAECIELLYQGNVVANLLLESYSIEAKKGTVKGYSVRIRRITQVTTSMETINGEHIQVINNNDHLTITNLPTDGTISLFDMTGKMLFRIPANAEGVVSTDVPQQGVYNIVVESSGGHATIKTIVR